MIKIIKDWKRFNDSAGEGAQTIYWEYYSLLFSMNNEVYSIDISLTNEEYWNIEFGYDSLYDYYENIFLDKLYNFKDLNDAKERAELFLDKLSKLIMFI